MSAGAPELLTLPLRAWQLDPGLDVAAALALAMYGGAARRVRGWPLWRSLSFAAGVLGVLVALQSGVGAYDDSLLSDHMVQHLVLLLPAPALLVLGRPLLLLLRALPAGARRDPARALARARRIASPLASLILFSLVLLVAHLPVLFDATLRHPLLHEAEHVVFLGCGLLFWTPLLDGDPGARRLGGVTRFVYVLAAMPAMAAVGAYLNRARTIVYTPYGAPARALGISAVRDQQQAGAIMWVAGGMFLVLAGLWVAMAAMSAEERRLRAREARASAQLSAGRPRL